MVRSPCNNIRSVNIVFGLCTASSRTLDEICYCSCYSATHRENLSAKLIISKKETVSKLNST
ncbi:DUF1289 domain-containing protein [Leptospira interrogans serovar Pomona]|nr:DUF1289 domain-containing protein [Leptospira interrogans serovar Pomona]